MLRTNSFEWPKSVRLGSFLERKRILAERYLRFTKGLSTQDSVFSNYSHIFNIYIKRHKAKALFF